MAACGKIDDSPPDSSPFRAARPCRSAPAGSIVDLRKLLAERFPHAPAAAATRLITSLSFLDQAIGGGLPKSAITELISPRISAGSASLIHALLQSGQRNHYFVALIDGETTLKRYVVEHGRPYLKAENPRYPDLIPARELKIQGVMVSLIRKQERRKR